MEAALDAQRFLHAQDEVFNEVLSELRRGRKLTHWMWFVFPQADGLGWSSTSKYYALKSLAHTLEYARHPVLGSRLAQCTELMIAQKEQSATRILGSTDTLKFRSSMTLFAITQHEDRLYREALETFFAGEPDAVTVRIVEGWRSIEK